MRRFLLSLGASAPLAFAAAPVDYAAKIAPLFQEHCIDCHGKDDPEGEFNLESFADLMKGGKAGRAIEPGKAEDSLLVKFLEGRSGKKGKNQFMPPGKKEHLKSDEIGLIRQWIDAGAPPPAVERNPADVIAALPKIAPKGEPTKAINALAFTAKGGLLAEGLFGKVLLLDAATQKLARTLPDVAGKVNALLFSADGTMLFAAAGDAGLNGIAYQWRVSDGSLVRKFEGHTDAVYALALSPDGQTLATGSYDQKIRLWSTATGTEEKLLKGHNGGVFGLSFRADGKVLASASADRTVKLWDVASGKRLDTFSQPLKEQSVVVFAPDGKTVAAAGVDNRIRVWNVTAKAVEGSNKILSTRYAHEGALLNLAYSADGKQLVSSASDRTVKIWDAKSLTELHLLEKQADWTPALAFVSGNKLAVGRLDGTLAFYDVATGKAIAESSKPPVSAAALQTAKGAATANPKKAANAKAKMAVPPGTPDIIRLEPRGIQSGATTTVTITGKTIGDIKEVKFSDPRIAAKVLLNTATEATLEITAPKELPRAAYKVSLLTPAGESARQTLHVDDLPQITLTKPAGPGPFAHLPVNIWGTLTATGQQDSARFAAKSGEAIILDLAARRIDSKMVSPRLEIFDSAGKLLDSNNGLDSGTDPFIAFTAPRDGEYTARVREITLEGSANHFYRLTIGALPYVTGWWPLAVAPNLESKIHLVGLHLPAESVSVKAGPEGEVRLPAGADAPRSRVDVKAAVSPLPILDEAEPNDAIANAQSIAAPVSINGRLFHEKNPAASDTDHFRFEAEKGQAFVIETRAAMMGSPADTKIDILDAKGAPVPMTLMQATKDSWLTLRSKDASEPAIRLGQFAEMELNDYMYFNGEVLKIFRLARGPDADMIFYANGGKRRAYFNTSPAGHGLDDVCYVVEPKPVGAKVVPNGLPLFTINYANDDDGERELGRDSRLMFTAPAKGTYLIRVTDTRGWSGDRFAYQLIVRAPQPDYAVKLRTTPEVTVPAGSGVQFTLTTDRQDGFDGEVRVDISGVPAGFFVSSPLVIQAGHLDAAGCFYARTDAKPGAHDFSGVKLVARATINGREVTRNVPPFPKVNVTAPAKKILFMESDVAGKPSGDGKSAPEKPYEITIAPGTTVSAWLRVDRRGDDALIACDVENLPHGVIIDNIGLNGVQIRAGEQEREIFLSCAKWVPEQDRLCQVVAGSARNDAARDIGAQAGFPVLLKVRQPQPVVNK
jgi:mono/diheme cytochrome c family protein